VSRTQRPASSGRPVLTQTTAVVWERRPTAPSIPRPMDAFGYEEDDDGTMQLQAPPEEPVHPVFKVPYARVGPGTYTVKSAPTLPAPVARSFNRAKEFPMGAYTGALPFTTTSPGGHCGISRNPLPRSTHPSASFATPAERHLGTGVRAPRSPNKCQWRRTPAREGTLRDMHRRPGESGTTGWGDRRDAVPHGPGPGAHDAQPGVGRGRPVHTFPLQRQFRGAQLSSLRCVGGACATSPPKPPPQPRWSSPQKAPALEAQPRPARSGAMMTVEEAGEEALEELGDETAPRSAAASVAAAPGMAPAPAAGKEII